MAVQSWRRVHSDVPRPEMNPAEPASSVTSGRPCGLASESTRLLCPFREIERVCRGCDSCQPVGSRRAVAVTAAVAVAVASLGVDWPASAVQLNQAGGRVLGPSPGSPLSAPPRWPGRDLRDGEPLGT